MGGRPHGLPPSHPPTTGEPTIPRRALRAHGAQKHHDAGINVLNLATRTARAVRILHLGQRPITAIETYIDGWNERCQPFTWTKTADEILTKATRGQRSSFTRH